jgi:hypothetical protein
VPLAIAATVFYDVPKNTCVLYVPSGSAAAYDQQAVWTDFVNIVEKSSLHCGESNGIAEVAAQNVSIYPNPVKNELFIQSEQPVEKVEIINLSGRTVETLRATSLQNGAQSINVSSLPAGVYLVKIGTEIRKFVKE